MQNQQPNLFKKFCKIYYVHFSLQKNIGSALLPSIKIASPCNLLVTFIDQFCACYLQYDPNKLFKENRIVMYGLD